MHGGLAGLVGHELGCERKFSWCETCCWKHNVLFRAMVGTKAKVRAAWLIDTLPGLPAMLCFSYCLKAVRWLCRQLRLPQTAVPVEAAPTNSHESCCCMLERVELAYSHVPRNNKKYRVSCWHCHKCRWSSWPEAARYCSQGLLDCRNCCPWCDFMHEGIKRRQWLPWQRPVPT